MATKQYGPEWQYNFSEGILESCLTRREIY
jgi:hypothetical protein